MFPSIKKSISCCPLSTNPLIYLSCTVFACKQCLISRWAIVGLMDRVLDLKPEVTQGCGFESRLWQEVHDCSPGAAQSAAHCSKCVQLGWVKCREHISLLIILCIIVYVTNKAHPSLICIVDLYIFLSWFRLNHLGENFGLWTHILTGSNVLRIQTQLLISEAGNWWTIGCGLLVDYCDVFISCLDSHSDGTHSLQRIHWWASDAILHFSKSEEHEEAWRNKLIYIFNGLSVYFSKCTFLGELLL